MAHITTTHFPRTIRNPFRGAGEAILGFLTSLAENNARIKQVERLNALSDEQLEKVGIKRENIVRHVFRDVYYV